MPQQDFDQAQNRPLIILFHLGVLALTGAGIFGDFLFGQKLYLFTDIGSDTVTSFWPRWHYLAEYWRTEGLPGWSWEDGMGRDLWPFALSDPFTLFYSLIGAKHIPGAIAWVEFFKLISIGLLTSALLREMGFRLASRVIGSVLLAFSGFALLGSTWYYFSTELLYLMLWLYGFERIRNHGSSRPWLLAVVLVSCFQLFDLFLFGVFTIFWWIFRSAWTEDWNWNSWLRIIGLGALGMLLAAPIAWPQLLAVLDSGRMLAEGSNGLSIHSQVFKTADPYLWKSFMTRLFGNDLTGSGWQCHGWQNYLEAPAPFIGTFSIAFSLVGLYYQQGRKRLLGLAGLGLIILIVAFPWFRQLSWAFTVDYWRLTSTFVALPLMIFALSAHERMLGELPADMIKVVPVALGICILLLWYPWWGDSTEVDELLIYNASVILSGHFILTGWAWFSRKGIPVRSFILPIWIAITCFEMGDHGMNSVRNREVMQPPIEDGYFDQTAGVIERLEAKDPGFWRVQKSYRSSFTAHQPFNESLIQHYRGHRSYHSFQPAPTVRYWQKKLGEEAGDPWESNWIEGPGLDAGLLNETGTKYGLALEGDSSFQQLGWEYLYLDSGIKVWRNPEVLPFGSTSYSEFELESWDANRFSGRIFIKHYGDPASASTKSLNVLGDTVFFRIPFDPGWSFTIQHFENPGIDLGFTGVPLTNPLSDTEIFIEGRFRPRGRLQGILASFVAVILLTGFRFGLGLSREKLIH